MSDPAYKPPPPPPLYFLLYILGPQKGGFFVEKNIVPPLNTPPPPPLILSTSTKVAKRGAYMQDTTVLKYLLNLDLTYNVDVNALCQRHYCTRLSMNQSNVQY